MKQIIKKIFIGVFLSAFLTSAVFAASSPIPILQTTANKIIAELKQNQAKLKGNPKVASNIVMKYLLPLVDQQTMAQSVLGRDAWNKATSAQKTQFIAQFRTLVVGTYASAFAQFNNETVQFKPLRGNISGNVVQVQSVIQSTVRPSINVNYNLVQKGGSWKIIDFSVDGISMINSFQSQFAGILASQGISGLITTISQHNKKNS